MTGFWDKYIVPPLIGCACSSPAIMKNRGKIVPLAHGDVLEIGCGSANLPLYNWGNIKRLSGIDPSPQLLAGAQKAAAKAGYDVNFAAGIAEALPFDSESFDSVVTTFTLCSVQDQAAAISEARRVLRPGGMLYFAEHGKSPDPSPARWQKRIEPFWSKIAGGCQLTRGVAEPISTGGFAIVEQHGRYMKMAPKWLGWVEYGQAQKAAG
ncbi:MAG: class I SAM-dependent methyltransferase [Sphingorhabdus sp.]|nr:class I SAM-dependent methyltransferase [Sphingorhabdus sp.]